MRWVFAVFVLWASAVLGIATPGTALAAGESVDVALVLVTDVSRSVHDGEFDLMKQGYVSAFTDRDVVTAIKGGVIGSIAVAYVEFAGAGEVRTVVDWTVIRDEASAQAFATKLRAAPRSFWGRTSISSGIDHAMKELARAGYDAQRRIIDVCGDGTNNHGRDVAAARDEAVEAGVTINGLAIINDNPIAWNLAHTQPPGGLTNYYREHATGGIGTFVLEIHDFRSFGEAMKRKLLNEIASLGPPARL
ncbi:MAG: DUF1194 domain-containing protein [Alphaproteobacteria bacterium]|nr:DUF1194 domain-containing protein [Alphaproteobacteria bacterium]